MLTSNPENVDIDQSTNVDITEHKPVGVYKSKSGIRGKLADFDGRVLDGKREPAVVQGRLEMCQQRRKYWEDSIVDIR